LVRFIKIMFLLLCLAVFAVIALFGPKFWRLNDHITLCSDDYDPRYISDPIEREKVCTALAEDI
jgi:hypothetical protein